MLADVAEADAADVDLAVAAAREAFDNGPWSKFNASAVCVGGVRWGKSGVGAFLRVRGEEEEGWRVEGGG